MGMPLSVVDTGKSILGLRTYTDFLIPNCNRCFIISGHHKKTNERSYTAFCKKTGKLEKVGPYKSYHEALRFLVLTKGCDNCTLNKCKLKEVYLPVIDEHIKAEIEAYGIGRTQEITLSPLQDFVESRNFLDTNFKAHFGFNLFLPLTDDAVAIKDLVKPCINQAGFALKIQALAGIIDRINEKELRLRIQSKEKERIKGSLNTLELFLKEAFPSYPRYVITNLRNLLSLRSKTYPAHATASEVLVILRNFGLSKYPPNDWEEDVSKIIHLCSQSLYALLKMVQNGEN